MEVKSEILPLRDVLDQLVRGELRVPNLQRPFVWTTPQMRLLLESIRKGYPIGSVLVWETEENLPSRDSVGPVQVGAPPKNRPVAYLLDGQQRLTTLLGCLRVPDATRFGTRWRLTYDPRDDAFIPETRENSKLTMPLRTTMDSYAASLHLASLGLGRQEYERVQLVINRFYHYQIPVIRLRGAALEEAVEVFGRLNTAGKPLTKSELLSALAFGRSKERPFDLSERFGQVLERLGEVGLQELSRTTLLRAYLAALGEANIFETNMVEVVDRHRDDAEQALQAMQASLLAAGRFLQERLGVNSAKALPYGIQLVLSSEFFRSVKEPSAAQLERLELWLWATSFSRAYAVGNSKNFNSAISQARGLAETDFTAIPVLQERAQPFPGTFHGRSARVRATLLVLKALRPRSFKTGEVIEADSLLAKGFADTARLSPSADHTWLLANRVLLGAKHLGERVADLANLANQQPDRFRETLRSHAISLEAWDQLQAGSLDAFVALRRKALIDAERKFLTSRSLPEYTNEQGDEEQDEPIDTVDPDDESET